MGLLSEYKTRGSVHRGIVASTRAKKTAVVVIEFTIPVHKFERVETRRSKIPAHVPDDVIVHEGDTVEIAETRKISKTKAFVVTKVLKKAATV